MRRALLIFALGAALAPAGASAQSGGGSAPADRPSAAPAPAPPASPVPGGTAPTGGTVPNVAQGATGGNSAGRPFRIPPVIRSFSASPRSLVWGSGPTRLRFRVDATNLRTVRVVLDVRATGARSRRRVSLGRVRTGRVVTRRWARAGIDPGTYRLALRVVDARGRALARAATATITVKVRPRPRPRPAPAADPAPAPAPSGSGVFPVRGPVTWGEGFGVDRGTYRHNGQDLAAASGTPLVSPRRGTVHATGSGGASGYYVVIKDAERDHYYVYFHLLAGSTVVSQGQSVSAGQRIASVGSTGRSTGPHLHFELWVGGWGSGRSVDPAPFLRSLS